MSTQFDPDGWQYATTLDSPFWHPQNNNALCKLSNLFPLPCALFTSCTRSVAVVLRRRTWHRKLQRLPRGTKNPAASQ